MQNDTTLGERVSEAREAIGLSLEEAAQRMAVKTATLKGWEAGKTQPRPNKLQMLAGVLGVPFSWLLDGSDEHDPMSEDNSRLDQLEHKLTRMRQLQAELGLLCDEIAHELAEIRKVDEQLEELVA
ncbi:MAG: helix-turn-helix domain-containing protein [Hyphomicrobiales bacterium]|nr:helix-turn-helix domain-containing protein [Hyphomicrobiales bacterium]